MTIKTIRRKLILSDLCFCSEHTIEIYMEPMMERSIQKWHVSIVYILICVFFTDCKVLDDYIKHYEELHYDSDILHQTHIRRKRSADHILHIPLKAFGRETHLELKKDSSVFTDVTRQNPVTALWDLHLELKKDSTAYTDDYQTELSNGTLVDVDLSFLYSGKVRGIPGSFIHGSVIQGVFQGSIHLPDEVYHVQKSRHFFNDQPVFHSVIYRESDMNLDPYKKRRERERREAQELGTCGYDRAVDWMRDVQRSEVKHDYRYRAMESQGVPTGAHNKYSASSNQDDTTQREKRESKIYNLGAMNTCVMELRSDPVFWDKYMELSEGNEELAKDEILAFFSSHVQTLNRIYDTMFTTYDGQLGYGITQFAVERTKIFTREDCNSSTTSDSKYCQDGIDVSNFLHLNSLENHDGFCLSYMFTNRDFMDGTLGLAWVGASDDTTGGVCAKWKSFRENGQDVYKSLNTGIVTTKNNANQVPPKVSQLTFAHEVGHNFGSPHDTGDQCAPYETAQQNADDGNFVMYAYATRGDKVHNSEFSPCSKDNITRVLDVVVQQIFGKQNCFQMKGPFCGNGIVEQGEQCDCGFEDQCDDLCCNPKKYDDKNDTLKCTLKSTALCSPSEGPCCTKQCGYVPATDNKTCRYDQDCSEASYCSGSSAACPEPVKKLDGTYCNNYGFTCKDGECGGSLCERFDWTECFISSNANKLNNKEEQERLCQLACETNGTTCVISSTAEVHNYPEYKQMVEEVRQGKQSLGMNDNPASGITLASGSPCNNYQGYCDVFSRCRGVNAAGPLSRLTNLLFNPNTLAAVREWIVKHWWAVLLMAVGVIIIMGLFIKFCAVHTSSSNPDAKPAKKQTDTLQRRKSSQGSLNRLSKSDIDRTRRKIRSANWVSFVKKKY